MVIKSLPEVVRTSKGLTLSITVDEAEAENLYSLANKLQPGKQYDLSITRHYEKRSVNANAYAWKLIGLISAEVGIPPIEVYQQFILDSYCYRDVLVKDDDIKKEISDWKNQGYGWLCEVLGPSPQHDGYTWIRKYRGSSSFNSMEMSRFIDNIIFEAKEFGIETEPREKIQILDD